jgi:putative FmdB family regulatory protein
MPIYEYECEKCGGVFELIHAVSADPPKNCETKGCMGKPRRMVSAGGFILKGDGWYANDYPSESRKKGWESESSQGKPAAPAESKSEGSPASDKVPAPAAKPEPKPAPKANSKNPYSGGKSKTSKKNKASK